ncbi:major outer membrane protein [Campylobacter sp. 19-13652]|uniref:major outer membrane protein n=1 Tax=Campylobacter sp. 19-13652 TaxID=2840180 RepID=UPI001C7627E9|nr:major outer membrane protein [Campylobacter sp. 19-13652]BCX79866.1 major outer membrane protein [Campylobacter sp. 19-13652]
MKLAKLSLATLIALGAVSAASATPLEEAIKNVDLSGFARYRYTNLKKTDNHGGNHQFKMITNFKAAYDDNFYGVLGLRYVSNDGSGNVNDTTDTTSTFKVHQFYLGYKAGNTDVRLGKQQISSFVTDDLVGTGALVTNSDIEGLTLAAFAFDALENPIGNGENDGALWDIMRAGGSMADYGNLYGVAAIGSYDPIAFQLWYADATRLTRIFALEVSGNVAVSDDLGFNAKVQYAHSAPHSEAKDNGFAKTDFYGVELGSEFFGAEVNLGYFGWNVKKAKNGADGMGVVSLEDQGSFLDVGEQLVDYANDYTLLNGKGNFFYATAGYTFDEKYFAGVDAVTGKVKDRDGNKTKYNEYVGRLGYEYSKKLKFSSYYSYIKIKPEGDRKESSKKIRFEAKYTF